MKQAALTQSAVAQSGIRLRLGDHQMIDPFSYGRLLTSGASNIVILANDRPRRNSIDR